MRYRIKDGDRTGTYDGLLKNHLCEGKGTIYYDNGDKFVGTFINGYKEGYGEFYYNFDKTCYKGNFHLGLREGIGYIVDQNNRLIIEGRFKNNNPYGRVIEYSPNGEIRFGFYENGHKTSKWLNYYPDGKCEQRLYSYDGKRYEDRGRGTFTRDGVINYIDHFRKKYKIEHENNYTVQQSSSFEEHFVLEFKGFYHNYNNISFYDPEEEFQKRKEIQERKQREQEKQRLIQQKIQQQIQEERQQEYLRKQEEKRFERERQREERERWEREREREIEEEQAKAEQLLNDARFYYEQERYDYAKWRVQEALEHACDDRWIIESCEDLLEDIEKREL